MAGVLTFVPVSSSSCLVYLTRRGTAGETKWRRIAPASSFSCRGGRRVRSSSYTFGVAAAATGKVSDPDPYSMAFRIHIRYANKDRSSLKIVKM